MSRFILDCNNDIESVKDEKEVFCDFVNVGNSTIQVLITEEKEYYNVFVIHEDFRKEYSNCLNLQEPKECVNKEMFNKLYCEIKAIEFYMWHKYNKDFNLNYEDLEE